MSLQQKVCFVVRPIGEAGSDVRAAADDRYAKLIRPVCEECGYERVFHAGEISEPGMISRDVIQAVIESELVIADLTDNNPNVFYELALRHALRKPYACLGPDAQKSPFDTNDCRYVPYSTGTFAAVDAARDDLKAAVEGAERKSVDIESPISDAIDLLRLGRGGEIERSVKAIRENSERMLRSLSDLDGGIRWRVYEELEKRRRGIECVMEEIVMDLQHHTDDHSSWILSRLRVLESQINDIPKTSFDGLVIGYLRELLDRER